MILHPKTLMWLGVMLAFAFVVAIGAGRVMAVSSVAAGPLPVAVVESPAGACVEHARYSSSFGHGEFQRDGFERGFWDRHFAWGNTNPAGGDAAVYSDRAGAAAIVDDAQTGDKDVLRLRAQPETQPAAGYSGSMIATWSHWRQRYGYFSARMRLPKGQGLWPAFWMLDANGNQLEWDIQESLNDLAFVNQTEHVYAGKMTYGGMYRQPFDPSAAYHDYGVLLRPGPGGATFFIDGNPVPGNTGLKDITAAHGAGPLGEYMMISMQVGAQKSWPGPPDATTSWPADLYVAHVRAFKLTSGSC